MTNLQLAFVHLNLRWNPFGEIGFEDIHQLAIVQVEQYVDRLQRPGFALQFRGEPGRGKTTHLFALREYFPQAPYLHFYENAGIPDIPQASLLFLDDTQWLPASLRKRIFSPQVSLVIGTLSDHSKELKRAGLEHYSVHLVGITVERLEKIIQRRIEWARRGPGLVPMVPKSDVVRLIQEYDDDLRAIFSTLYEEFQALEAISDVKLSISGND